MKSKNKLTNTQGYTLPFRDQAADRADTGDLWKKLLSALKGGKVDTHVAVACMQPEGISLAWKAIDAQGKTEDRVHLEYFAGEQALALSRLKAWLKVNKLTSMPCALVLPSGDYSLLLVDTPTVSQAEMQEALKWLCSDLIDVPLDQVALATFPVKVRPSQPDKINVIVTNKYHVLAERDALQAIGLQMCYIDIANFAMVTLLQQALGQQSVAVLFGPYNLMILDEDGLRMSRILGDWQAPLAAELEPELAEQIHISMRYYREQFDDDVPEVLYITPGLLSPEAIQSLSSTEAGLTVKLVDNQLLGLSDAHRLDHQWGCVLCEGILKRWLELDGHAVEGRHEATD